MEFTNDTNVTNDTNNDTNVIQGIVSFEPKKVRFFGKVHVFLIPNLEEYIDIKDLLWYNLSDYNKFKFEADLDFYSKF